MATAGVTSTTSNSGTTRSQRRGSFFKRNKTLVIGGGGIGMLLLMSHFGKSASGGSASTSANQLQAAANNQAALDSAAMSGLGDPSLMPGGTAPVDTGGGSYTAQGPTATGSTLDPGAISTPVGPINVTVPPSDVQVISAPVPTAPGQAPKASRARVSGGPARHARGSGSGSNRSGASHPKSKATTRAPGASFKMNPPHEAPKPGTASAHPRAPVRAPAKPSQPHPTAPAPASKSGSHPATPKKTASGHRKGSPVEVEAMIGAGAGLVIQGRHFPGARGYRQGPPCVDTAGRVTRLVTIDYGGHTESHLVHGNGDEWTDNVAGVNPPGRGAPQRMPGRNHAAL